MSSGPVRIEQLESDISVDGVVLIAQKNTETKKQSSHFCQLLVRDGKNYVLNGPYPRPIIPVVVGRVTEYNKVRDIIYPKKLSSYLLPGKWVMAENGVCMTVGGAIVHKKNGYYFQSALAKTSQTVDTKTSQVPFKDDIVHTVLCNYKPPLATLHTNKFGKPENRNIENQLLLSLMVGYMVGIGNSSLDNFFIMNDNLIRINYFSENNAKTGITFLDLVLPQSKFAFKTKLSDVCMSDFPELVFKTASTVYKDETLKRCLVLAQKYHDTCKPISSVLDFIKQKIETEKKRTAEQMEQATAETTQMNANEDESRTEKKAKLELVPFEWSRESTEAFMKKEPTYKSETLCKTMPTSTSDTQGMFLLAVLTLMKDKKSLVHLLTSCVFSCLSITSLYHHAHHLFSCMEMMLYEACEQDHIVGDERELEISILKKASSFYILTSRLSKTRTIPFLLELAENGSDELYLQPHGLKLPSSRNYHDGHDVDTLARIRYVLRLDHSEMKHIDSFLYHCLPMALPKGFRDINIPWIRLIHSLLATSEQMEMDAWRLFVAATILVGACHGDSSFDILETSWYETIVPFSIDRPEEEGNSAVEISKDVNVLRAIVRRSVLYGTYNCERIDVTTIHRGLKFVPHPWYREMAEHPMERDGDENKFSFITRLQRCNPENAGEGGLISLNGKNRSVYQHAMRSMFKKFYVK